MVLVIRLYLAFALLLAFVFCAAAVVVFLVVYVVFKIFENTICFLTLCPPGPMNKDVRKVLNAFYIPSHQ